MFPRHRKSGQKKKPVLPMGAGSAKNIGRSTHALRTAFSRKSVSRRPAPVSEPQAELRQEIERGPKDAERMMELSSMFLQNGVNTAALQRIRVLFFKLFKKDRAEADKFYRLIADPKSDLQIPDRVRTLLIKQCQIAANQAQKKGRTA